MKIPRLLRCVHVPTMFLLLLREALATRGNNHISGGIFQSLSLGSGKPLELMNSRIFETLTSVCQMIYLHRFQSSRIEEMARFDSISQEMAQQIVQETFNIPQVSPVFG